MGSLLNKSLNRLLRCLVKSYPLARGKHRLLGLAMRKVRGLEIRWDVFGNLLLLDLSNYIDAMVFLNGSYESRNILTLKELCERYRVPVFIDVEANIGLYSLTIARYPWVKKVYAFEPDPRNWAQLIGNIFLNGVHWDVIFEKLDVRSVALSSQAGMATLYVTRNPKAFEFGKMNTGTSSLVFARERHGGAPEVEVPTAPLDDIVRLSGERILVKIDVEGHELAVLEGMRRCLQNNHCLLMVEVWPGSGRFEEVDGYLAQLGYRIRTDLPLTGSNHIWVSTGLE